MPAWYLLLSLAASGLILDGPYANLPACQAALDAYASNPLSKPPANNSIVPDVNGVCFQGQSTVIPHKGKP